jgi:hypothetical protein
MNPFLICMLAVLISGCGVATRSLSKPAFDNLSGTYRYVGLGSFTPSDFPNPLIEFANITVPCDVEVSQEGRIFTVLYRSSIGSPVRSTVDLNKRIDGVSWEDNELVTTKRVPVSGPIILPLPGRHYRGTRLFQDENGNLVIVGFFKEKGLFWTDYSEEKIILQRRKD